MADNPECEVAEPHQPRRRGLCDLQDALAELDPAPADRLPLRCIESQLPGREVCREGSGVLDAEIHATRAHRRVHMRGIAAEEGAARLVALCLFDRDLEDIG